jgi:pyruvate,orthophosphate dikinase
MQSATDRYVYEFADGSREMRELLGGKGAGLAEMTRLLGREVVPAGFTITTEACIAYLRDGSEPYELAEQIATTLYSSQSVQAQRCRCPG